MVFKLIIFIVGTVLYDRNPCAVSCAFQGVSYGFEVISLAVTLALYLPAVIIGFLAYPRIAFDRELVSLNDGDISSESTFVQRVQ